MITAGMGPLSDKKGPYLDHSPANRTVTVSWEHQFRPYSDCADLKVKQEPHAIIT